MDKGSRRIRDDHRLRFFVILLLTPDKSVIFLGTPYFRCNTKNLKSLSRKRVLRAGIAFFSLVVFKKVVHRYQFYILVMKIRKSLQYTILQ